MTPRELIHRLCDPPSRDEGLDPIPLLRSTEGEMTVVDLAAEHDLARRTVYRQLETWTAAELVDADEDLELTAVGEAVLDALETVTAAADVDRAALGFLAASHHRDRLLARLATQPHRKADLARADDAPSRTTVHRAITAFEDRGWVRRDDQGRYTVTEHGETVLDEYRWLETAVDQAVTNAPLLRRLNDWADPPLHALERTDLVVESEDTPHALLDAVVEAAEIRETGVDHVRTIVPLFSPIMFDVFGQLVDRQTTVEAIYDQHAVRQMSRPRNLQYLAGTMLAPNLQMRIYPERLGTGIGIYDDTVMIAASPEYETHAGVVGDPPELYDWATATFETYWERSHTPADRLRTWLQRTVSLPTR